MRDLIERLETALEKASPVEWEAVGEAICDKDHGFGVGRFVSEIYPTELDEANAELAVLAVNNLPEILAALKAKEADNDQ